MVGQFQTASYTINWNSWKEDGGRKYIWKFSTYDENYKPTEPTDPRSSITNPKHNRHEDNYTRYYIIKLFKNNSTEKIPKTSGEKGDIVYMGEQI